MIVLKKIFLESILIVIKRDIKRKSEKMKSGSVLEVLPVFILDLTVKQSILTIGDATQQQTFV